VKSKVPVDFEVMPTLSSDDVRELKMQSSLNSNTWMDTT